MAKQCEAGKKRGDWGCPVDMPFSVQTFGMTDATQVMTLEKRFPQKDKAKTSMLHKNEGQRPSFKAPIVYSCQNHSWTTVQAMMRRVHLPWISILYRRHYSNAEEGTLVFWKKPKESAPAEACRSRRQ